MKYLYIIFFATFLILCSCGKKNDPIYQVELKNYELYQVN